MIYIVFFSFSTLLLSFNELLRKRYRLIAMLFVILSIMLVSVLNGVRNFNIGTDILVYGNQYFNMAVNSQTIKEYLQMTYSVYNSNLEYGYQLFNYFISRFTNDIHWYYFWLGVVTNCLIYLGINQFREDINVPIAWLVYLLMFYGNTLNIMRQSLALGFVFLGLSLYIKGNRKLISIIFIGLASFFHQTAIVGFLILALYIFLEKSSNSMKLHLRIIVIAFFAMLSSSSILALLSDRGILNSRLEQYVTFNSRSSEVNISTIGMRLPFVIYWTAFYKNKIEGKVLPSFMYILIVLDFVFLPMRAIDITVSRIVLYIAIFKVIAFPLMIRSTTKRYVKIFSFFIMILFLLISWYLQVVVNGNGEIFPFESDILYQIFQYK